MPFTPPRRRAATPSEEPLAVPAKDSEDFRRNVADLMADGVLVSSRVLHDFTVIDSKDAPVSFPDMVGALRRASDRIKASDLSMPEAMLAHQAIALNAIFGALVGRARLNMGEYIGAAETYMRMALKAQAQCRATIQTLGELKNPRTVLIAKQANVTAGPQQVNNGAACAPASQPAAAPNELLENSDGERLDTGAPSVPSSAHPRMVTLDPIDRACDGGGQGAIEPQRMARRAQSAAESTRSRVGRRSARA